MTVKPFTDDEMANLLAQIKMAETATDETPVRLCSRSMPDGIFPDGETIYGDIVTREVAQNWIEHQKAEMPNRDYWYEYVIEKKE